MVGSRGRSSIGNRFGPVATLSIPPAPVSTVKSAVRSRRTRAGATLPAAGSVDSPPCEDLAP